MSELPAGWASPKLGDLIVLNPKNDCGDSVEVGFIPMPLLGTSYRDLPKYERRKWSEVKKGYTHFADNDVLLAKITPCFENGKAGIPLALPNGLGAGSTEYFVCRAHNDVLTPEYLLAFFKTDSFLHGGEVTMTGSVGHKRVPKEFLLSSEIPLAPLNEQKRIADKLDSLLKRVDACRERLDNVPVILKRFRQAVLAAATSGALTEDWRENSTSTQDNELPVGWSWTTAGKVCMRITDGEHITPTLTAQGVPLLSAKDVRDYEMDFSNTKFVSEEFSIKSRMRCNPEFGDVLVVSRGATVGRTCRVKIEDVFCLMGSVLLFKPNTAFILPQFLECCFKSPSGLSGLVSRSGSSAQQAIYIKDMKAFPLPQPPIPEQAEIVRRVEKLFTFADRLEARYATARKQVDQLTPSLLAKAFRGELVEQDPNDEPASVLLERIKTEQAGQAKATRRTVTRRAKG